MAKTGRQSIQQMLRLPEDLRDRIKREADAAGRSLNAEIVETLEQKYPAPTKAEMSRMIKLIDDLIDRVPDQKERDELRRMQRELMARLWFEEPEA